MTRIQYTGGADEAIFGRFAGGVPTLRFRGSESIDVSDDVAAEAVARYDAVAYDPPRCGVVTGDETPCERPVDAVGSTCHQHDASDDEPDTRPYIRRVRDDGF